MPNNAYITRPRGGASEDGGRYTFSLPSLPLTVNILNGADTNDSSGTRADIDFSFGGGGGSSVGSGISNFTTPLAFNAATDTISISQASSTVNGYLLSSDWIIFNNKATSGDINNLQSQVTTNLNDINSILGQGYTNSNDVIGLIGVSGVPLTYLNGIIGITKASSVSSGYLSAQDWITFASGNIIDSRLSLNVPLKNTTNVFTAKQTVSGSLAILPINLVDASTITTDASLGSLFYLSFTSGIGNTRVLGNPTNPVDGQRLTWAFKQDPSGNRVITFDTKFAFGTDLPSVTLSTASGKIDYLSTIYNLTNDKHHTVSLVRGF